MAATRRTSPWLTRSWIVLGSASACIAVGTVMGRGAGDVVYAAGWIILGAYALLLVALAPMFIFRAVRGGRRPRAFTSSVSLGYTSEPSPRAAAPGPAAAVPAVTGRAAARPTAPRAGTPPTTPQAERLVERITPGVTGYLAGRLQEASQRTGRAGGVFRDQAEREYAGRHVALDDAAARLRLSLPDTLAALDAAFPSPTALAGFVLRRRALRGRDFDDATIYRGVFDGDAVAVIAHTSAALDATHTALALPRESSVHEELAPYYSPPQVAALLQVAVAATRLTLVLPTPQDDGPGTGINTGDDDGGGLPGAVGTSPGDALPPWLAYLSLANPDRAADISAHVTRLAGAAGSLDEGTFAAGVAQSSPPLRPAGGRPPGL